MKTTVALLLLVLFLSSCGYADFLAPACERGLVTEAGENDDGTWHCWDLEHNQVSGCTLNLSDLGPGLSAAYCSAEEP